MERNENGRGVTMAFALGFFLLGVPVLYVASVGPFTWLLNHELIELHPWAEAFYWPLSWICLQSETIRNALGWYQGLI